MSIAAKVIGILKGVFGISVVGTTLTIGTAAMTVSIPGTFSLTNVSLPSAGVLSWNSDTSVYRAAAGAIGIGTGAASGAGIIAQPANTASALQITDGTNSYHAIDTRTGVTGVKANAFGVTNPSFAAAAGNTFSSVAINAFTLTQTGSIGVTALNGLALDIASPTVTDASALTVTTATAMRVNGPLPAGSVTFTNSVALDIPTYATNGTAAAGLRVAAPTGATSNYAIQVSSGSIVFGSDTGLARNAAGVFEFNNGTVGTPATAPGLTIPNPSAAGTSGSTFTLTASSGVDSASGSQSGGGGSIVFTGGTGANNTSTGRPGAGASLTFTGGAAGTNGGSVSGAAANGGGFVFNAGASSSMTTSSAVNTLSASGGFTFTGATGGSNAGTTGGAQGSKVTFTLGAGGATTGGGNGGAAGIFQFSGATGGSTNNAAGGTGGTGSSINFSAGAGGAALGAAGNGGNAGVIAFNLAVGGTSVGGSAGNRSQISIRDSGAETTADTAANVIISSTTNITTRKLLVLQGNVNQSGSLQEWQKSDGTIYGLVTGIGSFQLGSANLLAWSSTTGAGGTLDTSIYRLAAGVIGIGSGAASGTSWFQQSAGGLALASNFTDATGTLAATNFSFPVISGRTYKITGYIAGNNTTGTEGFQMTFHGVTATAILFEIEDTGLGTVVIGTKSSAAIDTVVTATTFTNGRIRLTGYVQPSATGNLVVQMAEVTHATGTLTVNANTWINLEDMRAV